MKGLTALTRTSKINTQIPARHRIKQIIVPKNHGGGIVDPTLKLILQSIGFKAAREIDEMEVIEIEGGTIMGLPFLGEHADLNIRTKIAQWSPNRLLMNRQKKIDTLDGIHCLALERSMLLRLQLSL